MRMMIGKLEEVHVFRRETRIAKFHEKERERDLQRAALVHERHGTRAVAGSNEVEGLAQERPPQASSRNISTS